MNDGEKKQREQVSKAAVRFVNQAVIGTLRQQYRLEGVFYYGISVFKETSDSKVLEIEYLGNMRNYLNGCYRDRILEIDQELTELLDPIMKPYNHSLVCIMLILGDIAFRCIKEIDWKGVDFTTLETFDSTLTNSLAPFFIACTEKFTKKLYHTCKGPSLKDLDANEILFKIKKDPMDESDTKEIDSIDPIDPEILELTKNMSADELDNLIHAMLHKQKASFSTNVSQENIKKKEKKNKKKKKKNQRKL